MEVTTWAREITEMISVEGRMRKWTLSLTRPIDKGIVERGAKKKGANQLALHLFAERRVSSRQS